MPPNASPAVASAEEFERWANIHTQAASLFRGMAEARRTGNAEMMGDCFAALVALGATQEQSRPGPVLA
jgi:hypothetical protein